MNVYASIIYASTIYCPSKTFVYEEIASEFFITEMIYLGRKEAMQMHRYILHLNSVEIHHCIVYRFLKKKNL